MDVVQVGDHKALELLVFHVRQPVYNVFNQGIVWVLHQNKIGCYAFFNMVLSVQVYFPENLSDLYSTKMLNTVLLRP